MMSEFCIFVLAGLHRFLDVITLMMFFEKYQFLPPFWGVSGSKYQVARRLKSKRTPYLILKTFFEKYRFLPPSCSMIDGLMA
jgi:hypothetical protein